MTVVEIAFILLLVATFTVGISPRLNTPMEVILLICSLFLGFIPGLPKVRLSPELVFSIFLPPILFAAAYFTSWRDFKANLRPIGLLAVGLVIFTTAAVAWVMHCLVPGLSWPLAVALGAMISPPDASAATAITKKLGVPRRLVTIIEGESLVNDATALVLYRFAVGAVMTGSFSLAQAGAQFVWMAAGGVLVGFLVGYAGIWIYKRMSDDNARVLVSFLTAFGAYSIGEHAHVSGVISTVTAGLSFGRFLPVQGSAEIRIEAQASWELALFVINGFVFTLIGLQLPSIMHSLAPFRIRDLFYYSAVLVAVVMAVRFIWVFPATYLPRWLSPALSRRDPSPRWQAVIVLSYTGMRGIVSLAAALSLPILLPSGEAFPQRDLLIFLTYVTILVTLLLPSLTLPALLRFLGVKAGNERFKEETLARLAAAQAVVDGYGELAARHAQTQPYLEQMKARYLRRARSLASNLKEQPYSEVFDEDRQVRRLLQDVIALERQALHRLRLDGAIHDEIFHLPGTMPQIFRFTVRDEGVAKKLGETMGTRVVIKYNEHRGVPSNIFGETSYFVSEVKASGS